MPDTVISPNMNMPVPVVSTDPGPDWATNVNACLSIIDSHTHTTDQGVQITPDAININADLPMNDNNLTEVRSVNFTSQSAPLPASGSDLGCLYESGVDLYYNDSAGNQIRITQSGTVTGATGTITGLPSGTASASFAGATFTFQSATNTPAVMAVGPLVIGRNTVSPYTVTVTPSGSQAADYSLTLPIALPSSPSLLQTDVSGNLSFGTQIQAGTTSSTFTFNGTAGGTTSAVTVRYQRVGDYVTVFIPVVSANSGTSSGQLISNTAVATWARPLTTNCVSECPVILDNSVATNAVGILFARADGLFSIAKNKNFTAFTNSSTCGTGDNFVATYYVGTGS